MKLIILALLLAAINAIAWGHIGTGLAMIVATSFLYMNVYNA